MGFGLMQQQDKYWLIYKNKNDAYFRNLQRITSKLDITTTTLTQILDRYHVMYHYDYYDDVYFYYFYNKNNGDNAVDELNILFNLLGGEK